MYSFLISFHNKVLRKTNLLQTSRIVVNVWMTTLFLTCERIYLQQLTFLCGLKLCTSLPTKHWCSTTFMCPQTTWDEEIEKGERNFVLLTLINKSIADLSNTIWSHIYHLEQGSIYSRDLRRPRDFKGILYIQ